jgi:hypothetical protein
LKYPRCATLASIKSPHCLAHRVGHPRDPLLQARLKRKEKYVKTITNILYTMLAVFALGCFMFATATRAQLDPAPDGDYPGGNTAVGAFALPSNGSAVANTAIGFTALWANKPGSFNTAIGTGALAANRSGVYNTATGFLASHPPLALQTGMPCSKPIFTRAVYDSILRP